MFLFLWWEPEMTERIATRKKGTGMKGKREEGKTRDGKGAMAVVKRKKSRG